MTLLRLLAVLFAFTWAADFAVGEARIQPSEIVLTGPKSQQRVLVLRTEAGKVIGELTPAAKVATSNPKVATVNAAGNVQAVGDGEAVITAVVGKEQATAKVKVEKSGVPFEP